MPCRWRVPPQDLHQQGPCPAADVDDGACVGEVAGVGDAGSEGRGPFGHGGVEGGCVLRVLREEVEDLHSLGGVESWLAGPDGVKDVLEGTDAAECLQEDGPRPHARGSVAAQAVPQRCQAEGPGLHRVEHAERGEQAEHAVQRGLVGAGSPGQLRGAHRAVGEEVGDAKLGRDIDGSRDVNAPDHRQHRRRGGAFGLGWLRPRLASAVAGRGGRIDRAHGGLPERVGSS